MSDSEDGLNDTFSNENSMDMVMKNIYEACDESNTDRVHVQQLIEFIKPYMEANVVEFNKLKENLDPNDTDPEITSEVFYNIMTDWARKFKQEDSFHNISPRHLENRPIVESTPRKSFGMRQQRVYAEAAALNLSGVEQTSFLGTGCNESVLEKSALEEQIKQLTHQGRKYNDELLMARNQLLFQEEQNVGLQNEIEKLSKDLKHEREINENLQKENKTSEEMRENSFNKQKCIDKLKKDFQQIEKENQLLQAQISSLDHERQKTEEKMVRIHDKLSKSRKEIIELREEINMKEEQLNIGEDLKANLLSKICELNDSVTNLQEANTCLKVEKEKVSKLLQENLKLQSMAALNFSAQKDLSEYDSNVTAYQSAHDITYDANTSQTHRPQPHVDIQKYFTPKAAASGTLGTQSPTQSTASASQKSLFASTPLNNNGTQTLHTGSRGSNVSTASIITKQNGRLSDVITSGRLTNHDASPIPFSSPIKTSKFTFFNIDSPIAKRCTFPSQTDAERSAINATYNTTSQPTPMVSALGLADQLPQCIKSSPETPIDPNTPPCMYVVARTTDRRGIQEASAENASFDDSVNEEEMLQVAYSSLASTAQASLMDEISAARDGSPNSSSLMGSERSCPNCNVQLEVKRRLDDLCDQIEWLKTENTSLRQSDEQISNLVQSKQQLEHITRNKDQKIEELNSTLVIVKDRENGLRTENAELTEKLSALEKRDEDFRQKCDELVFVKSELKAVTSEKEKLLLENAVDQSVNTRLKDDLKALEHTKKCLELKIENLNAAKEKLVEEHKNHIDDYARQIRQSRDDITQLEEKFYASHDQVTSLLADKDESTTANAKLYFQHQKLQDAYKELQAELQHYTTIIEGTSTKKMPTKHKLQLLLKTKDSYEKLEVRFESLIEAKKKESEELNEKVVELTEKCSQLFNSKGTPKKPPHDRTQLKMEKLREKLDHLEEMLKKEKMKEAALRQDLEHLQKCYETLIKEKLELLKETEEHQRLFTTKQNAYRDLASELKDMLSGTSKVRYNMLKFSKNQKAFFGQCDSVNSVESFVRHLEEVDIEHLSTQMDSFNIATDSLVNPNEIAKAKNDLQTIALILDTLCSQSIRNKAEAKALNLKTEYLSRPMSPDSPNLGAMDVLTITAAGDNTLKAIPIKQSDGFDEYDDRGEESNTEDEFDGLASDPFDALHRLYLPENLEFLITSFRLNDQCDNAIDLEAFVDEFALTFMVDCTGYKNRLRGQFEALQAVVTRLVEHLHAYTSHGDRDNARRRKQAMASIVRCLFELAKSAELYGAIQQEMRASRNIQQLIRHIVGLRELAARTPGGTLRGETVHVDSIHTSKRSAGQLCNIAPQSRIMSLLNAMRPSNVVRLLSPIAGMATSTLGGEMPFVGPLGWIFWPLVLDGCARMDPRPSRMKYFVRRARAKNPAV